ncbi:hypothetical protein QAD02_003884 [Eretmocerus hayati]|uniref:Uncharacterized protein n=1 Tax=Eretmocerus hayati TaxID=131215 RepID=A0ACC2NMW7_9HYME|nr:hypothetical protein QAD02_003884 [Eretmocerus hayati]
MKGDDDEMDLLTYAALLYNQSIKISVHAEILEILLNQKAYKNRSEDEKGVVLRYIPTRGSVKPLCVFIKKGVNLKKCGIPFTLHDACINSQTGILEYLLRTHFFDVDEIDNCGNTPLIIAIANKNSAAVKLLIEWGADFELSKTVPESNYVMTSLCYAVRKRERTILNLLLSAGATPNPNAGNDDHCEFFVNTRNKNRINSCLHARSILLANYSGWAKTDPEYTWFRESYGSEATDKCLAELEVLKTHVLYGSKTLYDFLKGDDVTEFICNNDVIDKFNSMNVNFLIDYLRP